MGVTTYLFILELCLPIRNENILSSKEVVVFILQRHSSGGSKIFWRCSSSVASIYVFLLLADVNPDSLRLLFLSLVRINVGSRQVLRPTGGMDLVKST